MAERTHDSAHRLQRVVIVLPDAGDERVALEFQHPAAVGVGVGGELHRGFELRGVTRTGVRIGQHAQVAVPSITHTLHHALGDVLDLAVDARPVVELGGNVGALGAAAAFLELPAQRRDVALALGRDGDVVRDAGPDLLQLLHDHPTGTANDHCFGA